MNDGPNLWWIFDSESKTFSTLPTGPLLVPALLLCAALYAAKALLHKEVTFESIVGDLASKPRWQRNKRRYDELVAKFVEKLELESNEMAELKRLEHYLINPY